MEELRLYEYDYDKPELNETFLAHHQIKGAKWGVMHGPPYPLGSDQSTGSSLKKGGSVEKKKSRHQLRVEARKKKKLNKQRAKTLERARQVRNIKNETKKKVLEKNDVKTFYENKDLFSEKEINQFISKYEADQKLKTLIDNEKKVKQEKVYQAVQNIQKYADTGSKLVKNLASFYDTYNTVTSAMEKRDADRKKAQVEAYKNKITSDRDLKTAYDKRNLFNEDELKKLMSTVDTDKELKERLKTWNPSETKVSAGRKKEVKQAKPKESQVQKWERQDREAKAKANDVSKVRFKNKKQYKAWRQAADEDKNYGYYTHQTEEYNPVTEDEVKRYYKQYKEHSKAQKKASRRGIFKKR